MTQTPRFANRQPWMTDAHCTTLPDWDYLDTTTQIDECYTTCQVIDQCFTFGVTSGATHLVYGGHQFPKRPYRTTDTLPRLTDRGTQA